MLMMFCFKDAAKEIMGSFNAEGGLLMEDVRDEM
jgi:hypothetical protein